MLAFGSPAEIAAFFQDPDLQVDAKIRLWAICELRDSGPGRPKAVVAAAVAYSSRTSRTAHHSRRRSCRTGSDAQHGARRLSMRASTYCGIRSVHIWR
jgi:hypothetical protein